MLSSPGNPAEWILCRHRASRAVLTSVHLSGRYQGHSTSLLLLFIFWNNEIYTVPNSIMEKEVSQSCGSLEGERSSEAGTAALLQTLEEITCWYFALHTKLALFWEQSIFSNNQILYYFPRLHNKMSLFGDFSHLLEMELQQCTSDTLGKCHWSHSSALLPNG